MPWDYHEKGGVLYVKELCKMLCKSEGFRVTSIQKYEIPLIARRFCMEKNSGKKGIISYLPTQSQVVEFIACTLQLSVTQHTPLETK